MNKKIIVLLTFISALFLSLAIYLSVFSIVEAPKLKESVYNQRLNDETKILRGSIYDKNGVILAKSEEVEGEIKRIYPYGSLYTHIIGYSNKTYGKTNLELSYNNYLLAKDDLSSALSVTSSIFGETDGQRGFDLYLTIDHKMQTYAKDILKGKNGSIIMLDSDGAVISMYSNPTFDPSGEELMLNFKALSEDETSPFLSRATQGLYAPGSTWKILTSAMAIEEGLDGETFNDEGKIILGGREYQNFDGKEYGEITLGEAFSKSSNVVFASLGAKMGKDGLSIYDRFLLGKDLKFDIPIEKSVLADNINKMSEADIASTSIGQGKLMVTPLYMAMVGSAIANDGEMVMPYLVSYAKNGSFRVKEAKREVIANPISAEVSAKIKEMMRLSVTDGTSANANLIDCLVYGKTGTAQNETDKSHDWFLGFAEKGDEKVTILVMLEYNGEGSYVSANLAKKMLSMYFGS